MLFTGLLWIIAQWVFLLTGRRLRIANCNCRATHDRHLDGLTSIINSWIHSISFTCIVTSVFKQIHCHDCCLHYAFRLVRMSVLFSIIRIIHGSSFLLKFTYACVAFFAACWVILIIEKIVQCASDPSWHHLIVESGMPFCLVKPRISIFKFTSKLTFLANHSILSGELGFSADCVAVSIIVVLPLCMLWRVKLPRRQRRMILSIFASSVVLAFGALFHTVGQILNIFVVMIAGINVEVCPPVQLSDLR